MRIIVDDDIERAADLLRPSLALYIGGMGARGVNYHHEVFARMGYEERAAVIQDHYLGGDKRAAIAAVPTAMVEDVATVYRYDQRACGRWHAVWHAIASRIPA